jgi:hypothetical protein
MFVSYWLFNLNFFKKEILGVSFWTLNFGEFFSFFGKFFIFSFEVWNIFLDMDL